MPKRLLIAFLYTLIILVDFDKAEAQSYQNAFEMPTQVVNKLMIDRMGFLWIASGMGVSKFDGIRLFRFKSADQSSLSVSQLCEDNSGRIWFVDLAGQIFYIQNEEVIFLKAYHDKSGSGPPKIAVYDNQLVATTHNGLFVLDLKTFKARYIPITNGGQDNLYSLTETKSGILVYGKPGFYFYQNNENLKKLKCSIADVDIAENNTTLSPKSKNDTVYQYSNPSGIVRKFVLRRDSINFVDEKKYKDYINSITIDGDYTWIHTTNLSFSLSQHTHSKILNVTDLVTDKEGNTWVATGNNGIFVKYYANSLITEVKKTGLDGNESFTASLRTKNVFYWATQRGALILFAPALQTILKRINFDPRLGPVEAIGIDGKKNILVGFQSTLIRVNRDGKKKSLPITGVKQILNVDGNSFVVGSNGITVIPDSFSTASVKKIISLFGQNIKYDSIKGWFNVRSFCDEICFDAEKKSFVISSSSGVFYITKNGLKPLRYKDKALYATSMCYLQGKLYIGTANDGLLVSDKTGITKLSVSEGLLSENITKLKPGNNHLWIIGSGPLQLLDLKDNSFENYNNLPSRKDAQIVDVNETQENAYLMTLNGLYVYPLKEPKRSPVYLDCQLSVKVNNKIRANGAKNSFLYVENNLSFRVQIPNFYYAKDIYIKYCLSNSADPTWKVTEPGVRQIYYHSLPPGNYTFKAIAVNPKANSAAKVITYNFKIAPPWWKRTWVRLFAAILIFAMVNYIVVSYHFRQIAYQRAFYEEQKSIRLERQRISSEIHDDVGAGLFAIHLYADRARKKFPHIPEINELNDMVKGIADKIRDVIWTTNTDNDNLENLIYYIQFQVEQMFENSQIKLISNIPDNILDVNVNSSARRDIYLIMRELAHNCIKHSKAQKVEMVIEIKDESIHLLMKDNGGGFEEGKSSGTSMGLENIQTRVTRWKGSLILSEGKQGTEVGLQIPLRQILALRLTDVIKKWQVSVFGILSRFRKK